MLRSGGGSGRSAWLPEMEGADAGRAGLRDRHVRLHPAKARRITVPCLKTVSTNGKTGHLPITQEQWAEWHSLCFKSVRTGNRYNVSHPMENVASDDPCDQLSDRRF